jgi:lipopolysaccharide export system permease protein
VTLLDRYFIAHIARATGIVLALLVVLFSFLSLTEELEDVGKGAFATTDAVSVVLLTMATRVTDLLPVTILLGTIIALSALTNHREFLAMRSAGISSWQLARTLIVAAATLAVAALALQSYVIPPAERKAQEFRSKQLAETAIGESEFWSKHERRFLRVGRVDFGYIPRDIEIFELGSGGRLEHLLVADKAEVVNRQEWLLRDVTEKLLDGDSVRIRQSDTLVWRSFLSSEQLATLIAPARAVSPLDLYRYITEMDGSGVDTRDHENILWHQIATPIALFAMALLGLPFALGSTQVRSTALRSIIGVGIGIAFYLGEQISGHVAEIYALSPALSALAPATLILLGSLLAIRRLS